MGPTDNGGRANSCAVGVSDFCCLPDETVSTMGSNLVTENQTALLHAALGYMGFAARMSAGFGEPDFMGKVLAASSLDSSGQQWHASIVALNKEGSRMEYLGQVASIKSQELMVPLEEEKLRLKQKLKELDENIARAAINFASSNGRELQRPRSSGKLNEGSRSRSPGR